EADIQQYYNTHQQQFQVPEEVRVRHILISVPAKADAKTVEAAKAKAEGILKQLHDGANFAALAKKYSDDPGSKAQGGELGYIQHGATVPEFDKTAFSLQPGQTSGVIRTQFGFHILQVEDRQPAHVKPLAGPVHDQVKANLTQQDQTQAAQKYATQLQTQAQQEGLLKMAAQNHLQVVTTDPVASGGVVSGLADATQLLTHAFTMKPGAPPATASTGDGYAVFKVLSVVPAHAPTFDVYKSHVLEDFRNQQIGALVRSRTQQLAIKAKEENNLAKAAKEVGATLKTSDLVDSTAQVPDLGSMSDQASVAFTLQPGQISGSIVTPQDGIVLKVLDK
ncbi:MAG: peptidylprolyl isomerase, partial [Candidatus Saccharimonadales bacterium]